MPTGLLLCLFPGFAQSVCPVIYRSPNKLSIGGNGTHRRISGLNLKCTQYKSLQGFYTVLLHIYPEKVYQYINNRFFVLSKLAGINFMLWNEVYPKSRS